MKRKDVKGEANPNADPQPWRCSFRASHGRCGLVAGIYPAGREPDRGGGRCAFHYGLHWDQANRIEVFQGFYDWVRTHEPESVWAIFPFQWLWDCAQGLRYFEREPQENGPAKYRMVHEHETAEVV